METQKKTQKEDNLILWKKGDPSPNPNGRPNGQRNYATIRWEAFKRIGEAKGMTPEEVENLMIQTGLDKSLNGDYRFYQDDTNRIHGTPKKSEDDLGSENNPINHVHKVLWE